MKERALQEAGTQITGPMPGTLSGKQKEWALTCGLSDAQVAAQFRVPTRTIRRLRAKAK